MGETGIPTRTTRFQGTRLNSLVGRIRAGAPPAPAFTRNRRDSSGFFLGLQHLPALVHAGLEVEMVRTAQFAGVLVLDISRLLQRVGGAAHATARRRGFSAGNGHFGILLGYCEGIVQKDGPQLKKRGLKMPIWARL